MEKTQSVVNEGFPGNFNLSLNEPELLSEYGQYLKYDHDLYFAKIQNVIRYNDLDLVVNNKDTKHLTSFEMAGISFIDTKAENLDRNVGLAIKMFATIFFDKLGLSPDKFYVKVCAGGSITDLTSGRYNIDRVLDRDILTYQEWKKYGVPEENFIWDSSRDTFLSLFMFARPTPWGHRNELLYDVGEGLDEEHLLDIGTVEYAKWKPVFDEEKGQKTRHYMIKDIEPWEHHIVACGMGVERLVMAANKYKTVMQSDHLAPLFEMVLEDSDVQDPDAAFVFVDTLRTLRTIVVDSGGYLNLTRSRRIKAGDFARAFLGATEKLGIHLSRNIEKYLRELDAYKDDFFDKDADCAFVAREIQRMFDNRAEEFPVWPRAEFYDAEDGFEQVVDEIMEEKGTEVLAIVTQALLSKIPDRSRNFRERRIKNNIYLKVISDDQGKEIQERHKYDKEELREIRFSNNFTYGLNTAVYIYRDKVAILSAAKFGEGGMIIENKEYTEIMRRIFLFMWNKLQKGD